MARNWEEIHRTEDADIVKKIEKCNKKSSMCLIIGLGSFFLMIGMLKDVLKGVVEHLSGIAETYGKITFSDVSASIRIGNVILIVLVVIFGIFMLVRSMLNWEKAELLAASRYFWIPGEEEIEDINQRFDNDMIDSVIDAISSHDTKSIEVGFDDVRINTSEGVFACYYNQQGYSSLNNYGTKQLAYYLASNCFPEGFVIYQKKIAPVGTNRYLGGVTDVGGEKEKQKMLARYSTMLNWLAVQIQDRLRLGTGFKLQEKEAKKSPTNDGQIVINKGYTPKKDGMIPL